MERKKSILDMLKIISTNWRGNCYPSIAVVNMTPISKRKDVFQWLSTIWELFPFEIVKNAFLRSGYTYKQELDYIGATEPEVVFHTNGFCFCLIRFFKKNMITVRVDIQVMSN